MTVPLPKLWWVYELKYSGGGNGKINEMFERRLRYTSKNSSSKLNVDDNRNQSNLNTRRQIREYETEQLQTEGAWE